MTTYRQKMTEAYQQVRERELTPTELKRREEIAKDIPLKDFEKRYGKEKGMQVKMGVATKMAKAESLKVVTGKDLLENKLIGVRETHRLAITITPETWKMGKVIKKK